MILSGQSRLLRILSVTALASVVALGSASTASAQAPQPRKDPQGPYVVTPPTGGLKQVEPGREIQWVISPVTNASPSPGVFNFIDELDGDNLDGTPRTPPDCETGGQGRGQETPAGQQWMTFPDEGDGTCDAFVSVDAPATGYTILCDVATNRLEIRNINLGAFQSTVIRFRTLVSPDAQPAARICNWGNIAAPTGQNTYTYPYGTDGVIGCSCLTIAPPSGYDADFTKTATIVAPATRLIPGAADALVQYNLTITNTGTEDITGGQLVDVVGGPTVADGKGLEWVSIDDCPAGLTCALNPTNTRLTVTGINLPATDPDATITVLATARVTCAAASNIDDGEVCNQADFQFTGQPVAIGSDDPDSGALNDPTCIPVVWNNLTTSQKFVDGYDDGNRNGQLDVGERVNFRIRARNAGTLTATNVVVTDDLSTSSCLDPGTITALDGGIVAAGVITWNVGDIAGGGGSTDVRFSAVITADTLCCNQASVQCAEREGCGQAAILTDDDATSEDPATTPADPTCISPGPQPDLQIEKTFALTVDVDGDGQIDNGDRVRWTITVVNNGAGPATAAELRDALSVCLRNFQGATGVNLTTTDGTDAGDDTCSRAYTPPLDPGEVCVQSLGGANGIVPGETVTVDFETQVNSVDFCCNQASVTYAERTQPAQSDDPATPGLVDDETCLVAPPCEPTGELTKTVDRLIDSDADARLEVGERIAYVLKFTNVGCGDLTNIRIQDASQACLGVDLASIVITPAAGATNNSAGGNLDVTIAGPLAPTESVTITFEGIGQAVGSCCNQATWTATEVPAGGVSDLDPGDFTPDQPTCNDWLEQNGGGCTGEPDLTITKRSPFTGCVEIGTVVDYTLTVTNGGACDATSHAITDVLPAGLTDVVVDPPLTFDAGTRTVSVSGGALPVGGSRSYTYRARVPCTGNGAITNTARVTYPDSTGATLEATDSTTVNYGSPDLATSSKTAVPNRGADGVLDGGDTVDFTITVRNTGACDATNVIVTDVFDAAVWNLAGATIGQGGYLAAADTVQWDSTVEPALGRVAPGTSVTLTITVPVAVSVTTETRVTNTATISAKGNDQSGCGGTNPTASPVSPEICIECAPINPGGQKLLANNRAVRADALRLNQLATTVFNNTTPNTGTCGETGLDVADGALEINADVTATLAGGINIPAADARITGDCVYIEVSERCQADDGGADNPIFVCKSRTTGDLTVRSAAAPFNCP